MTERAEPEIDPPTSAAASPPLTIDGMVRERYAVRNGRDIFAKASEFTLWTEQTRAAQIYPFFQPLDRNEGPEAQIYGRRVLMLGSNNYLGLTRHPRVLEAARRAITEHGTSMTGSRFLNGTTHLHEQLEERLATFVGKEAALVFTTGYQTNLGVISSLVDRNCAAVIDKGDHASIYDGCRLAEGEMLRFRHNDPQHLESVLQGLGGKKGTLVVVDGVFSMEGDIADLPRLVEVCQRHKARLLVDDAHAIGVIGEGGRGSGSHFGLSERVDLIVGTFSKSLASIGGFLAGDRVVLEWVKHFGHSMMFSASLPPSATAAALTALEVLMDEPERVEQLAGNAELLRHGLKEAGFHTGESQTPIVPITIGDEMATVIFWKELLRERGVYTNPVIFPVVPRGKGILRISCIATHTRQQLEYAIEQCQAQGRKQGLVP